jgi:hypothetical protein
VHDDDIELCAGVGIWSWEAELGSSLVTRKFCKIFQIPCHIESFDTCMKY